MDIKDPNLKVISRQKQLDTRTNTAEEISTAAFDVLSRSWDMKNPIRLLTVTAINLFDEDEEEQISLFGGDENARAAGEKLAYTMDSIREKFGDKAILFGGVINNDIGIDMTETKNDE